MATILRQEHTSTQLGDSVVGWSTLVRFMLRADRVKLPAWAGGIGLFALYVAVAVPAAYEDDLDAVTSLFAGPVGRMLTGPGHGLDEPTIERVIAGGYGLYLLLLSALMSILLVVRHTRVEEQTGRAELVRANVVGRHAGLFATVCVALITNLAAAAAVLVVMVGVGGFPVGGSALLACGVMAVGVAFAGVTTITVQLSEYSRAAAGMAGGVLAAAFVVRGGGDMASVGGTLLSWLSPLGWAQQSAPYVIDRWWPILLLLGAAAVTTTAGFVLSSRRDLGASFVAVRPGPARADPALGTTWGLAGRLQRGSIIGWTASLAVAGLVFGAFADALLDATEDLPEVILDLFGADDVLAGYLGVMALLLALLVAAYAILAVQGLRTEETTGLGDPVLATPISRRAWLGANLGITALGVVVMSVAVGMASGAGAALTTGDAHHLWDLVFAQLNVVPAVLVVAGVAAALYGVWPRGVPVVWFVVGYSYLASTFGELLDLPQVAFNLSPFEHIPQMPLDAFGLVPVLVLSAVAAVLVVVALVGFHRREYAVS